MGGLYIEQKGKDVMCVTAERDGRPFELQVLCGMNRSMYSLSRAAQYCTPLAKAVPGLIAEC